MSASGLEHGLGGKAAGARVGADRDRRAVGGGALDQRGDQRRRQIVKRFVAHDPRAPSARSTGPPRTFPSPAGRGRAACFWPPGGRVDHPWSSSPDYSGQSARRQRAPDEAQLCRGGGFERGQRDQRNGDAQHRLEPRFGHALDLTRRDEIDDQRQRRLGAAPRRRTMPTPRTSIRPAIAAGARTTIRSPARRSTVWSSATRRAPPSIRRSARSDLPAPDGPRSRTASPSIATAVAWTSSVAAHDCAGRRMQKRAPMTAPSASLRFSAQIMPRCASTICFEIDRPRPECVPNFSPAGRSV